MTPLMRWNHVQTRGQAKTNHRDKGISKPYPGQIKFFVLSQKDSHLILRLQKALERFRQRRFSARPNVSRCAASPRRLYRWLQTLHEETSHNPWHSRPSALASFLPRM
jgi:hypothetical protein